MFRLFTMLGLLVTLVLGTQVFAATLTDQQKIDALLNSFTTSNVTLIRNGEEHDGAYARQHFQDKLKETKDVATAEDFITKVASKSSHTGEAYQIKLKDGTKVDSNTWLHTQLSAIEKKSK